LLPTGQSPLNGDVAQLGTSVIKLNVTDRFNCATVDEFVTDNDDETPTCPTTNPPAGSGIPGPADN
jgi:hypothetical protein